MRLHIGHGDKHTYMSISIGRKLDLQSDILTGDAGLMLAGTEQLVLLKLQTVRER